VFDADFASDEDEEAQEAGADVEAGEKAVLEEERQTRRVHSTYPFNSIFLFYPNPVRPHAP
jgi:hypothetical protein